MDRRHDDAEVRGELLAQRGDAPQQLATAQRVRDMLQPELTAAGFGPITTEINDAGEFYPAEDYHQQYLDANPGGYDCHVRTGVACPLPPAGAQRP